MQNILAVLSDASYEKRIYKILSDASRISSRILYISMNKTYKVLIDEFSIEDIDPSKFFFIDAITRAAVENEPVDNCIFLYPPKDLRELFSSIIEIIKSKEIDLLIFDPISGLTAYHNYDNIIYFVTLLYRSLDQMRCSSLLTYLRTDEDARFLEFMKKNVNINRAYDWS